MNRTFTFALATIASVSGNVNAARVNFSEPLTSQDWKGDGGISTVLQSMDGLDQRPEGRTILLIDFGDADLSDEQRNEAATALGSQIEDLEMVAWLRNGENPGEGTWVIGWTNGDGEWSDFSESDVTMEESASTTEPVIEHGTFYVPMEATRIHFPAFPTEALEDLEAHVGKMEGLLDQIGDQEKVVLVATEDRLNDEQIASLTEGVYGLFNSVIAVAVLKPGEAADDEGTWVFGRSDDFSLNNDELGEGCWEPNPPADEPVAEADAETPAEEEREPAAVD